VFVAPVANCDDHSYSLVVQDQADIEIVTEDTVVAAVPDAAEEDEEDRIPLPEVRDVVVAPKKTPIHHQSVPKPHVIALQQLPHQQQQQQILIPIVQSASTYGFLSQTPRTIFMQQPAMTGGILVRPIHPLNKLPLPKLRPTIATAKISRPRPAAATARKKRKAATVKGSKAESNGGCEVVKEKRKVESKADTFSLNDVTKVDSSLPETILATEEEDDEEEIIANQTADKEKSKKESHVQDEDEVTEIVPVGEENKFSKVREKHGRRRKEDTVAGSEARSNKSRSIYSIAALCQISVNIGDPAEAGTGMVNSPGMVSLNSVGTVSPVGTPAPTPTPPAKVTEPAPAASAPEVEIIPAGAAAAAFETPKLMQEELILPDDAAVEREVEIASCNVIQNSSAMPQNEPERSGKPKDSTKDSTATKNKLMSSEVLKSKQQEHQARRPQTGTASSDLSVYDFTDQKSNTPPPSKYPRSPTKIAAETSQQHTQRPQQQPLAKDLPAPVLATPASTPVIGNAKPPKITFTQHQSLTAVATTAAVSLPGATVNYTTPSGGGDGGTVYENAVSRNAPSKYHVAAAAAANYNPGGNSHVYPPPPPSGDFVPAPPAPHAFPPISPTNAGYHYHHHQHHSRYQQHHNAAVAATAYQQMSQDYQTGSRDYYPSPGRNYHPPPPPPPPHTLMPPPPPQQPPPVHYRCHGPVSAPPSSSSATATNQPKMSVSVSNLPPVAVTAERKIRGRGHQIQSLDYHQQQQQQQCQQVLHEQGKMFSVTQLVSGKQQPQRKPSKRGSSSSGSGVAGQTLAKKAAKEQQQQQQQRGGYLSDHLQVKEEGKRTATAVVLKTSSTSASSMTSRTSHNSKSGRSSSSYKGSYSAEALISTSGLTLPLDQPMTSHHHHHQQPGYDMAAATAAEASKSTWSTAAPADQPLPSLPFNTSMSPTPTSNIFEDFNAFQFSSSLFSTAPDPSLPPLPPPPLPPPTSTTSNKSYPTTSQSGAAKASSSSSDQKHARIQHTQQHQDTAQQHHHHLHHQNFQSSITSTPVPPVSSTSSGLYQRSSSTSGNDHQQHQYLSSTLFDQNYLPLPNLTPPSSSHEDSSGGGYTIFSAASPLYPPPPSQSLRSFQAQSYSSNQPPHKGPSRLDHGVQQQLLQQPQQHLSQHQHHHQQMIPPGGGGSSTLSNFNLTSIFPEINVVQETSNSSSKHLKGQPSPAPLPPPPTATQTATLSGSAELRQITPPEILPHSIAIHQVCI
jgi:hypothetical protein